MAQFASASFAGTYFAVLQTVDTNFSKQTGYTQDAILGSTGAYLISNSTSLSSVYQHSGSPAGADCTVSADIIYFSAGAAVPPQMGVCGRMQAAAQTFYVLVYTHGLTNLRLFKFVAGTQTQLGSSYTVTLANNTPRSIRLRMVGDQISGELDGATVIGPVTDSAIATAGKAGVFIFNTRHPGTADSGGIDNLSGDDLTAPSDLSGNVTLEAAVAAGAGSSSASDLGGNVTLSAAAAAGDLGVQPGTVTSAPFKNKFTGALMPSTTIPKVAVVRVTDMATVLTLVDVATGVDSRLAISNFAVVPGVKYLIVSCNSDGSAYGAEVATAA